MATILEIYQRYKIMPNLQEHMLKVAGVALMIGQSLSRPWDETDVINACLLHDMGNILKFNLERFPDFLEPEGLEYWQAVKNDFQAKYGFSEHTATLLIAKELNVSPRTLSLIKSVGFLQAKDNFETADLSRKICAYADMRVAPHGVVLLADRLADLAQRYGNQYQTPEDELKRTEFNQCLHGIETTLFEVSRLKPEDITENAVKALLPSLQQVQLPS
jgi:hypothetical protein